MERKINDNRMTGYRMNRTHFRISIYLVFGKYGKQKMPVIPLLKASQLLYISSPYPTNIARTFIQFTQNEQPENPQEYKICLQFLKMFL